MAAKQEELATLAGEMSDIKLLVAVATKGAGLINEHFGHAKEFQVYEFSTAGANSSAIAASTSTARAVMATKTASDHHPRHQRLPCGVRGQDRRLPQGGP